MSLKIFPWKIFIYLRIKFKTQNINLHMKNKTSFKNFVNQICKHQNVELSMRLPF
jgi:hypothetical protein